MATLGGSALTLTDWAKRRDPRGGIAAIAELLSQKNDILRDMLWREGNLPTGHQVVVRTGLPTPVWRLLNAGIAPTKSTTAQITEHIGMLEDFSQADKDLAELEGSLNAFRMSELSAHLEGMNQEFSQTLFYGNQGTAPEEFTGFATRYASLTATNGQNIIDAGGTGSDNSSIWLVVWGTETVCGIFPKGSKAGLNHDDQGLVNVTVTAGVAGSQMRAYQDWVQWKGGLAIKDWRFAVRIANIDISDLTGGSAADIVDEMIRAYHRIPSLAMGRPSFYMNRTCAQYLDIQRKDDSLTGANISLQQVDGVNRLEFRGIPIGIVDQLTEAEAQIS